ncbi:MAG: hypothetical protein JO351_10675 [Candidatus Eremiobacteraeota bacterium]|nr:hypothetical protein [Candidatus Eremiobacteraeota bacterium]
MRLLSSALCTTVAVALLAGCGGSNTSSPTAALPGGGTGMTAGHHAAPVMAIPKWAIPKVRPPFHGIRAPKSQTRGIYVGEFYGSNILGYKRRNVGNKAPFCTVPASYANSIAVDNAKNLIDPDGGSRSVIIYGGPAMCGSASATIADPYGQPSDASSQNAMTGPIAVGNITDSTGVGSVSICTVSGGCTTNLTSSAITGYGGGVAMDNSGNCYMTSENSSFSATIMTYWAGCSGSGTTATGYVNNSYGGLEIDNSGNIVSVDANFSTGASQLYVYSGCNPACTVVGGPYPLHGATLFARLNKANGRLAGVEYVNGQVDIYNYSATGGLTYLYSFNNGLTTSLQPEGIAWQPKSNQ